MQYLSKEGYKKLKEELEYLKKVKRPQIVKAIQEAREKGDLRENAEYKAAKEEQVLLEQRIAQLEALLMDVQIIEEGEIDTSKVYLLSTVTIENVKTKERKTYTLVAPAEADFRKGRISVETPIGKALLGKKVGDEVKIKVPRGELHLKIIEIKR